MSYNRSSISVSQAIERIMEKVTTGSVEQVLLKDAFGRYLAEDLIADHDVPLFDRSMMDGFAIRAEDTNGSLPHTFEVVEAIGAGTVAVKEIQKNEAVRIMTGAPIPVGANAVVMLEETDNFTKEGKTFIQIERSIAAGEHISPKGEDMQKGTTLVEKGRRIGAGEVALLATFGYSEVHVYKRPTVGIIATGSELVDIDEPLAIGKIRNSNSYMLKAQLEQLGAIPMYYGVLKDEFTLSYEAVKKALTEVDFLITTGGVSVGDYDFIPEILKKLQADVLFNKVEMRPGSVTTVAYKDGKWIFGLSGNPSACFVGLELFVRPILKTYVGSNTPHLRTMQAKVTTTIGRKNPYTRFIRAKVTASGATCYVTPVGIEKSGIVSSLADANALLVVPPNKAIIEKGEVVDVICFQTVDGYFE